MKKLRHLLPSTLKEILGHIPEIAFDMVDWFTLLNTVNPLLRRFVTQEGRDALMGNLNVDFNSYEILFSEEGGPLNELKVHERQKAGDNLLKIFFIQIFSQDGCFIDLREHHFKFSNNKLHFSPSGMWIKWDKDFQNGLIKLYRGFYYNDSTHFEEALLALNLVHKEWTQEAKEELKLILKEQFAKGMNEPTYFELEKFHLSFMKLFNFLIGHKTKLRSDFIVLGAYLVSLYMTLELLGTSHQVKDIFTEIDQKFSKDK